MVDNVEFTGFFWFVFTTGILAIILSARIHQKTLAYRGLSMLLWVTLWSLVGSILFAKLGDLTTITVYHIPTATSDFSVGDVVPFVPLMNAGISGYAVAPCLAAAYYWILEFFGPRPRLAGAGLVTLVGVLRPRHRAMTLNFRADAINGRQNEMNRHLHVQYQLGRV